MNEIDELRFKAGFNAGYLLSEFEPVMLNMILANIQNDNSFTSGMQSGQLEYQTYLSTQELIKFRINKNKDKDIREL